MLVLEGRDAHADARAFREAGIGDFDVFDFEREGKRPDGTPIKVAFSLAFARDPPAPDIGFFTCQHRFPENFWNPAFQVHPNTAVSVAGVVLVATKPSDHYRFLTAFTGADEVAASHERSRREDAARRNPGDGSGGLRAQFRRDAARHRAAARGLRPCALPCGIWGRQAPCCAARDLRCARIPGKTDRRPAIRHGHNLGIRATSDSLTVALELTATPAEHGPGAKPRTHDSRARTQRRRHRRADALRQCAAAHADRRALRAGKPRSCAGNGARPEGDRRRGSASGSSTRPRSTRRTAPAGRARAASASNGRCRSLPKSARASACRC